MFLFCLVFALSLCASVYMCFVVTCWERADLLTLVCGVYCEFVTFPIGILGQVWYLIVSIPDLCTLTYFETLDRINRKSDQNWKSICFLTVLKHKFCTLNACQYNYRLQFVMKFAYNTFKVSSTKRYAKNCGSVS